MNVLAYDNNVYLVNLHKNTEDVYMVNIKQGIIQGYDNVHKIMRFGNYSAFAMKKQDKNLKEKIINVLVYYGVLEKDKF